MRAGPVVLLLGAVCLSFACQDRSNAGAPDGGGGGEPEPGDAVSVSPAEFGFGEVLVGRTATVSVLVRSEGGVPIPVRSIAVVPQTPEVELLDPLVEVPAGGMALVATYRPTGPGALGGAIVLELGSRDTPRLEVPLVGHSPGTPLRCEPPALDLGRVPVLTGQQRTLVCTNHGTGEGRGYVVVRGAATDSPDLTAEIAPTALAVGERTELVIRYGPTSTDALDATVRLDVEPDWAAPTISVRGVGTAEPCELEVTRPDPVITAPDTAARFTVQVRNTGASACPIARISLTEPCEAFVGLYHFTSTPLLSGEVLPLDFEYRPPAAGPHACELTITAHPPVRVPLSGECSYRGCVGLEPERELWSWWSCPQAFQLAIGNSCPAPLPLTFALENLEGSAFTLGAVPDRIEARSDALLPITFRPPGSATYRARLVATDPLGTVYESALVGHGLAPEPGAWFTAEFHLTNPPRDSPLPESLRCLSFCVPDVNLDGRVDDEDVEVRWNEGPLLLRDGDWFYDASTVRFCLGESFAYEDGAATLTVAIRP